MHYTPGDRFRLSDRVAQRLGVPGAAGVRVRDVIYGSEGESYRYYFTAEYTVGVLRRQSDQRVVCTATEKKERGDGGAMGEVVTAPMELAIVEQYRRLRGQGSESRG